MNKFPQMSRDKTVHSIPRAKITTNNPGRDSPQAPSGKKSLFTCNMINSWFIQLRKLNSTATSWIEGNQLFLLKHSGFYFKWQITLKCAVSALIQINKDSKHIRLKHISLLVYIKYISPYKKAGECFQRFKHLQLSVHWKLYFAISLLILFYFPHKSQEIIRTFLKKSS